jgi:ferredoxin-NADP reductase
MNFAMPTEGEGRHPLMLRVQKVVRHADEVLGLTLSDASGARLPGWTPGAHIDIVLPSGAERSYSLCGKPDDAAYEIAVLRETHGRGASREIHDSLILGALLQASAPRNQFALVEARRYVFIAGGIGVTPLLPMVRALAEREVHWEMFYLGGARTRMSFIETLADLAGRRGGHLEVIARDERERIAVSDILARAAVGSAVYCCGPDGLIREVERVCGEAGRGLDLHVERFGRPEFSAAASEAAAPLAGSGATTEIDPEGPFQVELRQTGVVLDVGRGESILALARQARTGLTFSCSDGYCGTCETQVIAGTPDHRDTVLSDEEKAANKSMMICVGRSRTQRLVLDL